MKNKKNPFLVEKLREEFALNKNIEGFLSLYGASISKISNKNTKLLWDKSLNNEKNRLDFITKDRIKKTYEVIVKTDSFKQSKLNILDIGIGNGWIEKEIIENNSKKTISITGLDIAEENIKKLKKEIKGFKGIVGDALSLNKYIKKKKYDYIFAFEIFEHIDPDKIFSLYKEIKKLLKKTGHLIISVPVNEDLEEKIAKKINYSAHVRRYTESIIKFELTCAGFKVINTQELFAFSSFYKIKTLISKIFKLRKPNVIIINSAKQ
ncbi:class I SAM-dependent methyltransferase [Patescibacteria group bacterium]